MKKQFIVTTPKDLHIVAEDILGFYKSDVPLVVALTGDLGAGKTALVQAIGSLLGVAVPITSPTFTIMKQYDSEHSEVEQLVHLDLYRIVSEAELAPLHFSEVLASPGRIVCVEWPERVATMFPQGTLWLEIVIDKDETRKITMTWSDE